MVARAMFSSTEVDKSSGKTPRCKECVTKKVKGSKPDGLAAETPPPLPPLPAATTAMPGQARYCCDANSRLSTAQTSRVLQSHCAARDRALQARSSRQIQIKGGAA